MMFHSKSLFLFLVSCFFLPNQANNEFSKVEHSFADYTQIVGASKGTIEMIAILGGVFTMGSADDDKLGQADERPQRHVTVDSFWMASLEITWDLYDLFLNRDAGDNPELGNEIEIAVDGVSGASMPYIDMSDGMGKNGYPVVNITQYAASTFCKWLSAKTGVFYRLPTEAEWEYACRAGTETIYSYGDEVTALDDYAWHYGNSEGKYQPVGTKKPNPFGLFDMHGNVAEWTLDKYEKDYSGLIDHSENPWNQATELYPRVVRGGSWYDDPENLRSATRKASKPKWKEIDPQIPKSLWWHTSAPYVGFRIVRPYKTPDKEVMEKYWIQPIEEK